LKKFNKLSRNNVKNLLTNKQIVVNGKVVTKYDYLLKVGDKISFEGKKDNCGLKIIYEDDLFIAINKPYGLLTVATDKEKDKTAYVEVSKYIKQNDKRNKVFVLHRLDKDTSGVLVFCKSERVKNELQDKWNELVDRRGYVAVVEGSLKNERGTLKSYLKEGKNRMVYSSKDRDAKLAITEYTVLKASTKYTLVDINLLTGRKHQIRVHFKDNGNVLVGDKVYGSTSDPLKRLCLHAKEISFKYGDKAYSFKTDVPQVFRELVK
jgi:23S rRNA pseudouridine1911/1915/1917 synthase